MAETTPIPDASRPGHVLVWKDREGYYAGVPDPDLMPNDGPPDDDELVDLVPGA